MSPQKQIARTVCIANIFELTHCRSEDIFKNVKESYASFNGNLKQRNQTQINSLDVLHIYFIYDLLLTKYYKRLSISMLARNKFI